MATTEKRTVVVPADWIPGPEQGRWTYEKYAKIPKDGHRYEVVRGVLYMAPAPNLGHQYIVGEIFVHVRNFVRTREIGKTFIAPVDVELSTGNIVQPDVLVVLKEHEDRLTASRIIGAPDLVVEVASAGTAGHDRREKQDAYAQAGVKEYWIALPGSETVEVLILEQGKYRSLGLFHGQQLLPSQILPGFPTYVEQFF